MTATETKEFVISRIVAEARSEAVSLSETEWQMLYWSEIHPPANISDLKELAERVQTGHIPDRTDRAHG